MNNIRKLLISGMGTGYIRPAPGTWGSAAVCALYTLVHLGTGGDATILNIVMVATAIAMAIVCVVLGPFAERTWGRKDPSYVTADEWVGQSVTFLLLPHSVYPIFATIPLAFFLFRLFDIIKPPPVRWMEHLPHGWGIMMDDFVAGIMSNIVAQLLLWRLGPILLLSLMA